VHEIGAIGQRDAEEGGYTDLAERAHRGDERDVYRTKMWPQPKEQRDRHGDAQRRPDPQC
jgi:hypothetical protein